MQKETSSWTKETQTPQLYSSSPLYKAIHPRSAFQRGQIGEASQVLIVEGDVISEPLCREAIGQECVLYTRVPDLAAAHMLIHDEAAAGVPFDLLLCELDLNDKDALHMLSTLCNSPTMPAVIVVGSASADDILMALRIGVADYLPLPIRSEHVRIAIERVLARRQSAIRESQLFDRISDSVEQLYQLVHMRKQSYKLNLLPNTLVVGPLSINTERHTIEWYGQIYAVTPTEYALLRYLAETPGQLRRYSDIVRWTHAQSLNELEAKLLLKSHARNLRRKFGPNLLEHVKGTGYILHELSPNGTID